MIRKLLAVFALSFVLAASFLGGARIARARVVGATTLTTVTQPDIQCFGGTNQGTSNTATEVCVDYGGNVVPTTTNAQNLGSSTLQYKDAEVKNLNSGGGAVAVGGQISLLSQTLAQAQALAPAAAGAEIYCSNCSPAKVLVATGTAAGNWADAVGAVFK